MKLFGKKKPNSVLGVDIGASSIKVVEFGEKKGRPMLLTYGYAELPKEKSGEALLEQPKVAGELLAQVCKKAGVKTSLATSGLSTSHVFTSILSLPNGKDKKRRQQIVNAEVSKLAPLPLSEMIIQTTYLDDSSSQKEQPKASKKDKKEKESKQESEKQEKEFRVMVTGSAKTHIQKYITVFKTARLDLKAIDTESLALIRSLIGKDKGAIMIIDIGSQRTTIVIAEKGVPFVSRSINLGGDAVTNVIRQQMNTSEEEAERIKRDLGTASLQDSAEQKTPEIVNILTQPLINEIRFSLQLYANMDMAELKQVEKIVLTGGASHLPGIVGYLSNTLNMNVYRGDPWARVLYPKDLEHVLQEIGSRMSVAIGLAMRDMP